MHVLTWLSLEVVCRYEVAASQCDVRAGPLSTDTRFVKMVTTTIADRWSFFVHNMAPDGGHGALNGSSEGCAG